MIISKTNIISGNSVSVATGSVSSGSVNNVLNTDFSETVSSNSTTFAFRVNSVGNCQYIALHGLSLPVGCTVTVSGTGLSRSFNVKRYTQNLVFFIAAGVTPGNTTFTFSGGGTKTISYVQAGAATTIDWGTNPGQPLHYLASQRRTRTTTNATAMPVRRVQEITVPQLRLTIRNVLKSWARDDLQTIREMYDDYGVLSQLDYEDDNRPDESCLLFELSDFSVATHSQTTALVDVAFTFKALA